MTVIKKVNHLIMYGCRYLLIIVLCGLFACGRQERGATSAHADSLQAVDEAFTGNHYDSAQQMAAAVKVPLDSLLMFDSENELMAAFGNQVKHSRGYYPEGMGEYANTLLFPATLNQVEFIWDDTIQFKQLGSITVTGTSTQWKTKEGITLGTHLRELEKLNGKPFFFSGFGWDYGGTVNWNEGQLSKRKIYVILDFPTDNVPAEYDTLVGDHEINSTLPLAQQVDPIVSEITLSRQ